MRGDVVEFETYVREHARTLVRFATVLADDPSTAEDVVQEVLLRAHARWATIGTADRPHAYVRRMVVNEMISWRRKWSRIEVRPGDELDRVTRDPTRVTDARDEIVQALGRLPARQRAAVVLRYFEDLDDAEIAEALGCRAVTVRGYLHRALKTLRVEIVADDSSPHIVLPGRTLR